ncbi:DUF3108 domain-containing protein [Motiliproteus sp. MSK22-1]|uniref:DUF3108 domain-containing protein n=1 Tax=Motiliproteus sp. MSK22-1 TaxID=1897630 RepID=UPI0009763C20|nr:DUF3108 domain-containing protein [Motiliproteus sp. MSK22-1]OMH25879.1 hypothetical protein BGP75_25545 [Motiliproteus sp. MSK22-1]
MLFGKSLIISLIALPLAFSSSILSATTRGVDTLPPFHANYSAKLGLSIGGEASRQLSRLADGQWLFAQDATALFATVHETSRFESDDSQVIPKDYEYLRKVLGKKRHALLLFDWDKHLVTNNVQDRPWKLAIKPGTLDKLNYQLQLRLDLLNGKTKLEYLVADGGLIKNYRFEAIGQEQIDTPLGKLNTIKVQRIRGPDDKRKTLLWFALDLDLLLVKLSQLDKKGKEFSLVIKELNNKQKH